MSGSGPPTPHTLCEISRHAGAGAIAAVLLGLAAGTQMTDIDAHTTRLCTLRRLTFCVVSQERHNANGVSSMTYTRDKA
eukprot:COSAG01_NODE_65437_length_273_cov_0.735632_1_plen_78_part_01